MSAWLGCKYTHTRHILALFSITEPSIACLTYYSLLFEFYKSIPNRPNIYGYWMWHTQSGCVYVCMALYSFYVDTFFILCAPNNNFIFMYICTLTVTSAWTQNIYIFSFHLDYTFFLFFYFCRQYMLFTHFVRQLIVLYWPKIDTVTLKRLLTILLSSFPTITFNPKIIEHCKKHTHLLPTSSNLPMLYQPNCCTNKMLLILSSLFTFARFLFIFFLKKRNVNCSKENCWTLTQVLASFDSVQLNASKILILDSYECIAVVYRWYRHRCRRCQFFFLHVVLCKYLSCEFKMNWIRFNF